MRRRPHLETEKEKFRLLRSEAEARFRLVRAAEAARLQEEATNRRCARIANERQQGKPGWCADSRSAEGTCGRAVCPEAGSRRRPPCCLGSWAMPSNESRRTRRFCRNGIGSATPTGSGQCRFSDAHHRRHIVCSISSIATGVSPSNATAAVTKKRGSGMHKNTYVKAIDAKDRKRWGRRRSCSRRRSSRTRPIAVNASTSRVRSLRNPASAELLLPSGLVQNLGRCADRG